MLSHRLRPRAVRVSNWVFRRLEPCWMIDEVLHFRSLFIYWYFFTKELIFIYHRVLKRNHSSRKIGISFYWKAWLCLETLCLVYLVFFFFLRKPAFSKWCRFDVVTGKTTLLERGFTQIFVLLHHFYSALGKEGGRADRPAKKKKIIITIVLYVW